ncbi:MAG TPA: EAL domain-containing protein [Acidimicrobiia bacterium]|nr:EAL domain-containing protein [Acidimicrobiia bacterium]
MKKHAFSVAALLVAALAVGGWVATSLLFANSQGTEMVASDAAVQLRAEETLSAVTVARSLMNEALVWQSSSGVGPNDETLRSLMSQASLALAETNRRVEVLTSELGEDTIGVTSAANDFVSASHELMEILAAPGTTPTVESRVTAVSESFDALTGILIRERDARERHIAAVRAGVDDVARAARFLVVFFTPAVIVVGLLGVIRRRQLRQSDEEEARRDLELRRARDEFLSAVAHELRTPLTAVVGAAQMLRNRASPLESTDREEMVDILAFQTAELADLIDNLLIFARANIGELSLQSHLVSVGDVVDKITQGWSKEELGRLNVQGEARVLADPLRLKQVLKNLLANAVRHGGQRIEVRVISDGPKVRIDVADDGPSIAEEVRSRMFEPYVHGAAPGQPATLGLGLTVARQLVHLMNGEISYRSRPTESVFTVLLPNAHQESPQIVPRLEKQNAPSGITASQVMDVIKAKSIKIVFQPIVELNLDEPDKPHTTVGVEALARFPRASPLEWFEAAAMAGLGQRLELMAIRAAIKEFASAGLNQFLSVNLSFETLMSPHLNKVLSGVEPGRLVLELTEASIINHYQRAEERIDQLRSLGYRLAVDDMGTAGTDLWHLVRLRPAFVKPHIAVLRDADINSEKRATVTGLHWLSQTLPIKLIVEGVETDEDIERLRRLQINWAQGHRFARPADLEAHNTGSNPPQEESDLDPRVVVVPKIRPIRPNHPTQEAPTTSRRADAAP